MAKKPQKKKYFDVEIPLIKESYETLAYTLEDLENKSIKIALVLKEGSFTHILRLFFSLTLIVYIYSRVVFKGYITL